MDTGLHGTLRSYFRSWKRHHIYFGLNTERRWLREAGRLFPAACCTIGGEWRPGEDDLPAVSVRISSEALVYRFPYGYRVGAKRGKRNPDFLNPNVMLREHIFPAIQNLGVRPVQVIFPIAEIARTEGFTSGDLCSRLASFLDQLPRSYTYAVDLANNEFKTPAYYECLAARKVTHVINDVTLLDQIQSPYIFTSDTLVVSTVASCNPEWQLGIMETVRRCLQEKKKLFCFIDDTGEESLHLHLVAVLEMMNGDLAKLSIIKREQAA